MPSILRDSLTFDKEDAVMIPDVEFKPVVSFEKQVEQTVKEVSEETEEKKEIKVHGFDMTDYSEEQREQVGKFLNAEIERLREANVREKEFIIAKATQEAEIKAEAIVKDGETHRDEIIKHAKMQAGEIFEKARQQGMKAGQQEKLEEIKTSLAELEETVLEMKRLQNDRFDGFSDELKWVACDVAERLVYKKIGEDDLYLKELVNAAIKEAKEAEWLNVELSDKLSRLVVKMRAEYENSDVKVDFETVNDADAGTVVINGSDRKVVASVKEQLENIKEYFKSFEEL